MNTCKNTGSGNSSGSGRYTTWDMPALPLSNSGGSESVFSRTAAGNASATPLLGAEEGGADASVDTRQHVPVVPLPNPGEGGPIDQGWGSQDLLVPIFPQPGFPCFSCGNGGNIIIGRMARVRFINGAYGYPPFRVLINNRFIVNNLGFASMTPYGQVAGGYQTITVTAPNGYIYLQKTMPFSNNEMSTIAIINAPTGMDLLQINDVSCNQPANMSCFRACNLASSSGPLNVVLEDGRVVFSDVRFKETTIFKRIRPGEYAFYLTPTVLMPQPRSEDIETISISGEVVPLPEVLVSFFVNVRGNARYTVYIFSYSSSPEAIQTMVVEDR